jgi:putative aminopeptidase FrvX
MCLAPEFALLYVPFSFLSREVALEMGTRIGRYVVVRDADGRLHGLAATAVSAVCDDDAGGALLLLPGGRMVRVSEPVDVVLSWLAGGGA